MANVPSPTDGLHLTYYVLEVGHQLHRVHAPKYEANQFNPGKAGNARFSPITDGQSTAIPTMYAGTSFDCAMMETAFHDVPHTSGLKTLSKEKLNNQTHSKLVVQHELKLVDLTTVALRKLGLKRNQLIDTEKNDYPLTRAWAEAIFQQSQSAQGLTWVSRQDDRARAFIFFGNRIKVDTFKPLFSKSLLGDDATYTAVLDLAEQIGVKIILPQRR